MKGWVRDLEAPIRDWVRREREADVEEVGSDEEEIMFRGRGRGEEVREEKVRDTRSEESGIVMDSFGDVENASFKYVLLLPISGEIPRWAWARWECSWLTLRPGAGSHTPSRPTMACSLGPLFYRTQPARWYASL